MKILLSNDDGYFAPGLATLAAHLSALGDVVVVAPERDRSGASNSLTLDLPIRLKRIDHYTCSVAGTPTDCVHVAITGMFELEPDIVVSGINHGPNMGDDTLYSGTVAAATEAFLLGIPAIAVSLAGKNRHFDTAGQVAANLVRRFQAQPFSRPMLLNVNVPDIPAEQLAGTEVTRLGRRHHAEPVIRANNPRGDTVYWVGPVGPEQDAGNGTDFHAIRQQRVSITPLMIDLTARDQLDVIQTWLNP